MDTCFSDYLRVIIYVPATLQYTIEKIFLGNVYHRLSDDRSMYGYICISNISQNGQRHLERRLYPFQHKLPNYIIYIVSTSH